MRLETAQFRQRNQALTRDLTAAWRRVWPALDPAALDNTFARWLVLSAAVAGRYRTLSAEAAADYWSEFSARDAEAGTALDPARFQGSMTATALAEIKTATRNGEPIAKASQLGFTRSLGAAQRMTLDAGRSVIMRSSTADPDCEGWRRVGNGGCTFCRMLIGRGAVYSADTVRFASHDRCHCSAEPVFEDEPAGKALQVNAYTKSARDIKPTDRARVRKWIAANQS